MSHPFITGQKYVRNELLAFVGSRQAQTGIICGTKEPGVVIRTSGGRHGANAGYADGLNADGTWTYFAQGETGDQDTNIFANRILIEGTRSVLLFQTSEPTAAQVQLTGSYKKRYLFTGEFCIGSWDFFVLADGKRKGNRLMKFALIPTSTSPAPASDSKSGSPDLRSLDARQLRARLTELGAKPNKGSVALREYFRRSDLLRGYILGRADGICDYCGATAPFITKAGEPFLETHHILRLADDGPDLPENVAALCPNCHREALYGQTAPAVRQFLIGAIQVKEQALLAET